MRSEMARSRESMKPPMRRNLPLIYAFAFLKMTLFPMAIITLFWKDEIGLTLTEIMLLQGGFSLATLLLEYPSGVVADRLGYRVSLSLACLIGIAGWVVYVAADSFATVLIAESLLGIAYAFVSGTDAALLFETLKAEGREGEYLACDGRMNAWAQTGEACGALFAGALYAAWPILPFVLQIGVWLLALVLVRRMVEAPAAAHLHPPQTSTGQALAIARAALIENPRLRTLILFGTVLGVASFYPVWLVQPYMQECGVPLAWFGPVWAGANLTVALFAWISARVHFTLGDRGVAILFLLLIAAGYAGLGLTAGLWSFAFYYLLTAMRGLQGPVLRHHLQHLSRRDNRASLLSLKSFAFRLLFVVTGPLIGLLADGYGLNRAFLILGLCLTLASIPLLILFLRHPANANGQPCGLPE